MNNCTPVHERNYMKNENFALAVIGSILKVAAVIVFTIIIYKGAVMGYDYGYRVFTEPPMSQGEGRKVEITLKPDMSAMEVGEMMEEKGLSRDAKLFAVQYLLSEYKEDIAPGTYEVSTAMTAEEIMAAMVPGTKESNEQNATVN